MKTIAMSILAIGMMVTTANAATIRANFVGGGQSEVISPGGTLDVELWVDLVAGDTLSGIGITNNAIPGLTQIAGTSEQVGWNSGAVNGPTGLNQLSAFASTAPALTAPGSYLMAVHTLQYTGSFFGTLQLTFDHSLTSFFDAAGDSPTWNALYNTSYAGYVAYGDWGNPGWGTKHAKGHQPTANPLVIHVPEPASIALIALGGIAVLRRRR